MNRREVIVGNLAATSANNIAQSQTPVSGTALTLNGTTAGVLDQPRRVLLSYGNEASPRTLVITGTGWEGMPQSETLSVPSGAGGTVQTQLDYKTVTSALPLGGGWTAAVTLGTGGTIVQSSPWVAIDPYAFPQISLQVDVIGTINWTVQQSLDDPNGEGSFNPNVQAPILTPAQMNWVNHPDTGMVAQTANAQGNYAYPPMWVRLNVNSGGAAGANTARLVVIQSGATHNPGTG